MPLSLPGEACLWAPLIVQSSSKLFFPLSSSQALNIRIRALGEEHGLVVKTLYDYARVLEAGGQVEEALKSYERAAIGAEKAFGKGSDNHKVVEGMYLSCKQRVEGAGGEKSTEEPDGDAEK